MVLKVNDKTYMAFGMIWNMRNAQNQKIFIFIMIDYCLVLLWYFCHIKFNVPKIKLGILFRHPVLYPTFGQKQEHSIILDGFPLFSVHSPPFWYSQVFCIFFEAFLVCISSVLCYLSCQEYCHSFYSRFGFCFLWRVQARAPFREAWLLYSSP